MAFVSALGDDDLAHQMLDLLKGVLLLPCVSHYFFALWPVAAASSVTGNEGASVHFTTFHSQA